MENVILIGDFKTNSLRKYMMPVYAKMNRHRFDSKEDKREIQSELIPVFFLRLRKFRETELVTISSHAKIPLARLELFEQGKLRVTEEIVSAYVWQCGGHHEIDLFYRELIEFHHPAFRASRLEHAQLAAQCDVEFPGLDYPRLGPREAIIFRLPEGEHS